MLSSIKVTFICLNLAIFHFIFGTDKHHSSSYSLSCEYPIISGFINIIILYFSSFRFFGNHTAIKRIDLPI
ncbi:MAG: hypothetical protein LBQ59_04640 [Candidatus Peribacteria bacterium]|nr:hypothetical protein [Candidatus Peribacteria bacterium]